MLTRRRTDDDIDGLGERELSAPVVALSAIYATFLIVVIVMNLGWL